MLVEIPVWQHQQVVEQLHPQVMDQAQGNLGQEVVAQVRAQSLPRGDQDDQQRHRLQQLQVPEVGHGWKQRRFRVGQTVDEILEDVAQHWLRRSENQETDDADQEQADVRPDIAEQAEVDFQARWACGETGVGHITRMSMKRTLTLAQLPQGSGNRIKSVYCGASNSYQLSLPWYGRSIQE